MTHAQKIAAANALAAKALAAFQADGSEDNLNELEAKNAEVANLKRAAAAIAEVEGSKSDELVSLRGHSAAEKFVKSAGYAGFKGAHQSTPSAKSQFSIEKARVASLAEFEAERKAGPAITTELAHLTPTRIAMVDNIDRAPLTILDLIDKGKTNSPMLEYVAIIGVTRRTSIVPENTGDDDTDTLKPISDLETELIKASAVTYADGYFVSRQMISDSAALATFLSSEFKYSFPLAIQDMILNGDGTGDNPTGIMHTTGVQEYTYAAEAAAPAIALAKAVRVAMGQIEEVGGAATGVVVNPTDKVAIDLAQMSDGAFYSNGIYGAGPSTLWGLPVAVSPLVKAGEAIVADWKQISLLDYEGLSVEAYTQHKDFAQRNLVYVLAELRAIQMIKRPNRIVIVKKGA